VFPAGLKTRGIETIRRVFRVPTPWVTAAASQEIPLFAWIPGSPVSYFKQVSRRIPPDFAALVARFHWAYSRASPIFATSFTRL